MIRRTATQASTARLSLLSSGRLAKPQAPQAIAAHWLAATGHALKFLCHTLHHPAYLLLYVAMFLLDDVIVLVTAMITLRATGLTATYLRYSHLIGAVVLIGIGAALLMAPELLSFTSA